MRIAAGREDEHRSAASPIELVPVDRDAVLHEPAEHDLQLARALVELGSLELLEPSPDPGSHPSRLHSSRPCTGTSGTGTSRGATPSRRCSVGRPPSRRRGYAFEPTELQHLDQLAQLGHGVTLLTMTET